MRFRKGTEKEKTETISNSDYTQIVTRLRTMNMYSVVSCLLSMNNIRSAIVHQLMKEIMSVMSVSGNRKHGDVSYLMKKDFANLKSFNWHSVVDEAARKCPVLVDLAVALSLSKADMERVDAQNSLFPKLGLVYSILANARNRELSKTQRVVSMLLYDNICDQ